jgi:hypothetical protein
VIQDLVVPQLVREYHAFYRTQYLVTVVNRLSTLHKLPVKLSIPVIIQHVTDYGSCHGMSPKMQDFFCATASVLRNVIKVIPYRISPHMCRRSKPFECPPPQKKSNRVKKDQLDAQLIFGIFRQPLHVSGVSRPIIRRYNRMYITIGTY